MEPPEPHSEAPPERFQRPDDDPGAPPIGLARELAIAEALSLAYSHLARGELTAHQLSQRLKRAGVDGDIAQAALDELHQQRYLDDASYARRFAEDRRNLDGWGDERIEQALRQRGIGPEHVQAALAGSSLTDHERAMAVLRERVRDPPHDDRTRNRALGILIRRGYESELAYDAVREFERRGGAST